MNSTLEKIKKKISETGREEEILQEFINYADAVFNECDFLFKACHAYLRAPDDKGRNAPLAAWRSPNKSPVETNKAMDSLNKLMADTAPLVSEMTVLKKDFRVYCNELTDYLVETKMFLNALFQKKAGIKQYERKSKEIEKKLLQFKDRANKMIELIPALRLQIQDIKKEINLLKMVN